jgi:hypothetical protein
MSEVKKKKYRGVMIPEGLIQQVELYIKSKEGQQRGFLSISSYVEHAVRKELGLA